MHYNSPEASLARIYTAEDPVTTNEILRALIKATCIPNPVICLLAAGVRVNEAAHRAILHMLKRIQLGSVEMINIVTTDDGGNPANAALAKGADVIFVYGSASKLYRLLRSSAVMNEIRKKIYNNPHFLLAGLDGAARSFAGLLHLPGQNIFSDKNYENILTVAGLENFPGVAAFLLRDDYALYFLAGGPDGIFCAEGPEAFRYINKDEQHAKFLSAVAKDIAQQ